jgi:hypothetical protein
MGTKNAGEKYLCDICGNKIAVNKFGGGIPVYGGKDMELTQE